MEEEEGRGDGGEEKEEETEEEKEEEECCVVQKVTKVIQGHLDRNTWPSIEGRIWLSLRSHLLKACPCCSIVHKVQVTKQLGIKCGSIV